MVPDESFRDSRRLGDAPDRGGRDPVLREQLDGSVPDARPSREILEGRLTGGAHDPPCIVRPRSCTEWHSAIRAHRGEGPVDGASSPGDRHAAGQPYSVTVNFGVRAVPGQRAWAVRSDRLRGEGLMTAWQDRWALPGGRDLGASWSARIPGGDNDAEHESPSRRERPAGAAGMAWGGGRSSRRCGARARLHRGRRVYPQADERCPDPGPGARYRPRRPPRAPAGLRQG